MEKNTKSKSRLSDTTTTILEIVPPATGQNKEVRDHLMAALTSLNADHNNPINGYVLVTFHNQKSYGCSMHTSETPYHGLDIPDMVRNRVADLVRKVNR